jgi:hypothetical protein
VAPAVAAQAVTTTGTVADLIVDNRLTGASLRYIGLRLDDGRSFALAGSDVDALSAGDRINATGTIMGKTFTVAWVTAASTGGAVQPAAASTTLTGSLAIFHMDYFAQGFGEYGLALRDAAGKITVLNVAAIPDAIAPNMQVSVDGVLSADGASMTASRITILAPAPALNDVATAPVTHNVLVIPLSYANAAGSYTSAQVETEFLTNVAPYYNEVSYGQHLLNITVACKTTTPAGCSAITDGNGYLKSQNNIPGGCDYSTMANDAEALASSVGYSTAIDTTHFVYVMLPAGNGCGWAGLAYVGYGLAFSANYNALWVYGHEIGHNFGLWHAGSTNCGGSVVGTGCGVAEYGDPFVIMGNIRTGHFNAMQKSRLGWIPASSVKTHSSGTQTYTLSPIEVANQATYAVKIPTSNANRTYWIEYRQGLGTYDAFVSGLPNLGAQIRVSSPFESASGSDDTEVLDLTPGDNNFDNMTLMAPLSYSDASTGVNITVNSATPGSGGQLSVTVSMGGKTNTTTTLGSSANPSNYGTGVTITATVVGSAATGNVAFTDGGASISGCTALALPAGAAGSKQVTCTPPTLSVGTHNIVATYAGDSANNGSTSSTLAQVVNAAPVTLANAGFESPAVGSSYQYRPAGAGWTFALGAGVQGNGSAWGGAAAPQGSQTGFIQKVGSMSQAITLAAGNYVLTFKAAQRPCCVLPYEHPIKVTLDGNQLGPNVTPPATSFSLVSIGFSVASGGSHTLAFTGLDAVDDTTFIDDIQLVQTSIAPASATLGSSANPANAGVSVSFTATVTGSSPTGTVSFVDGGATISGCSAVSLSGNPKTAVCTTSALASGTHDIVATYSGDGANSAATTALLSQVINGNNATLNNAGFEAPVLQGTFQYAPSNASWTFTNGAGIQGNGSAWGAATAPEGTQTAFIQSTGSISQSVNLTAGSYSLAFKVAQRACCTTPYAHPIKVTVDGAQIGSNVIPASTSFSPVAINFTVAVSGSHTIMFSGTDGTDRTTFIDAVTIGAAPPSSLVNAGFETPGMGATFQYAPSGAGTGWTFSAGTGIQGNGSAFGATTAPEGTQTAFIQSVGAISQTLTLAAGNYTLGFKAAQRMCCNSPYLHPIAVMVDGVQVGSNVTATTTSFTQFNVPISIATTGAHTITLLGLDSNDNTVFIDAVTLN